MLRSFAQRASRASALGVSARPQPFSMNMAIRLQSSVVPPPLPKDDTPEPAPGLFDKYKLYEPSRYVPATFGFFGFMSATGMYHFNEESQLLGIFVLFVGTVYAKGGDAIGRYLDEISDAILKEHNEIEDDLVVGLRESKRIQEEGLANYDQVLALYNDCTTLFKAYEEAEPKILHKKVVQQVENLMQVYVAQESKLSQETERLVVDGATAAVRTAFENNPNLQASAMTNAFAALENSEAEGKDVVGELYSEFFEKFRQESWTDRVQNQVLEVSQKVSDDAEAVRKQLIDALEEVPDVDQLLKPVGGKFDLVKDGAEGVVAAVADIKADARFVEAASDNKRYMSEKEYAAWEAESLKLSPMSL